jgi:hypothetical protein
MRAPKKRATKKRIANLKAKRLGAAETKAVRGGMSDIHFVKRIDKASPS